MGLCHGKEAQNLQNRTENPAIPCSIEPAENSDLAKPSKVPFYCPSPVPSTFKNSPINWSVNSTPLQIFKRPFPPPSPAKHIRALLARRHGSVKSNEAAIPEDNELGLKKSFGFLKQFLTKYELGEEVGHGHFGFTCSAKAKKGELKGQEVAVKVIPKSKMMTAIAIEDVRREVRILRSLAGHKNLAQFYEAYEDEDNVYIVMELCKGGELLDRILSRGGKYSEEDAKVVMVQILSVISFFHLQGVVHRDLKPENFLFSTKDEKSTLKVIDFGLSDFVKPDERMNDIVGSAYYVAPEVLHRSYGTEADMWSTGVIAYILLCGSRPFWARTESGIFRAILKTEPSFEEAPWPSLSSGAMDFVKRLLNKDYRRRMTASQALCHPWLHGCHDVKIPLDILVFRLVQPYICSSSLRKAALGALAKTLTFSQLFYLQEQFMLLEPNKNGYISMHNFKTVGFLLVLGAHDSWVPFRAFAVRTFQCSTDMRSQPLIRLNRPAYFWGREYPQCGPPDDWPLSNYHMSCKSLENALMKTSTDAMKDSRVLDYVNMVSSLPYRKLDFQEFSAAAISVHQLEGMDSWELHARRGYELFEKDGNRQIVIKELASELGLSPNIPVHVVLQDWIRHSDGKLSFLGFVKLLHR